MFVVGILHHKCIKSNYAFTIACSKCTFEVYMHFGLTSINNLVINIILI